LFPTHLNLNNHCSEQDCKYISATILLKALEAITGPVLDMAAISGLRLELITSEVHSSGSRGFA